VTPNEIREKNLKELAVVQNDLKEELFKLKMQKGVGQLEKSHRFSEVKREIARVKTIIKQKEGSPAASR
jgi:large subunit ribosomal protein L29